MSTGEEVDSEISLPRSRVSRLVSHLRDDKFRDAYMARQLKAFLAAQIRALRGDNTQKEFGVVLDKPQSVISRIENERDSGLHVQTLIDIAQKLKIGVVIRFVDFATFLRYTEDYSNEALAPRPYEQTKIEDLARETETKSNSQALAAFYNATGGDNSLQYPNSLARLNALDGNLMRSASAASAANENFPIYSKDALYSQRQLSPSRIA